MGGGGLCPVPQEAPRDPRPCPLLVCTQATLGAWEASTCWAPQLGQMAVQEEGPSPSWPCPAVKPTTGGGEAPSAEAAVERRLVLNGVGRLSPGRSVPEERLPDLVLLRTAGGGEQTEAPAHPSLPRGWAGCVRRAVWRGQWHVVAGAREGSSACLGGQDSRQGGWPGHAWLLCPADQPRSRRPSESCWRGPSCSRVAAGPVVWGPDVTD